MPCAYLWGSPGYFRNQYGVISGALGAENPKLAKRVKWITECASIAGFKFHQLNFLKGNATKYFIETASYWRPVRIKVVYVLQVVHEEVSRCYYLGSFPHRWQRRYKSFSAAAAQELLQDFDIGFRPEVPGYYASGMEQDLFKTINTDFPNQTIEDYLRVQRGTPDARAAYWRDPDPNLLAIDKRLDELTTESSKGELLEYFHLSRHMEQRYKRYAECVKSKYQK